MAVGYEYDPWTPPFNPLKVPDWFGSIEPPVNAIKMGQEAEAHQQQQVAREMANQAQMMKLDEMLRNEQVNNALGQWLEQNKSPNEQQLLGAARDEYLKAGEVDKALGLAQELQQARSREEQLMARNLGLVGSFAHINPEAAYRVAKQTGLADEFGFTPESLTLPVKPVKPAKGRRVTANDWKEFEVIGTGEVIMGNIDDPNVIQAVAAGRVRPYRKPNATEAFIQEMMMQRSGGVVPQSTPVAPTAPLASAPRRGMTITRIPRKNLAGQNGQ